MNKSYIFVLLSCILFKSALNSSSKYKKVIIFPSFAAVPILFMSYVEEINKLHPGSKAELFAPFYGLGTLLPLRKQMEILRPRFREVNRKYPEGINVIGISQGGLLARAMIETMPNHTVHTLVTVASPHGGVYGVPILDKFFALKDPDEVYRDNVGVFSYNNTRQNSLSITGYWKDPNNTALYYNFSSFLPKYNNEYWHDNSTTYKTNFLKLQKVVLFGGPGDMLLSPWQTCFFGFFDSNMTVVELRQQDTYLNDSLGLKTMDEDCRLHLITLYGASHIEMTTSLGILRKHILPHLK